MEKRIITFSSLQKECSISKRLNCPDRRNKVTTTSVHNPENFCDFGYGRKELWEREETIRNCKREWMRVSARIFSRPSQGERDSKNFYPDAETTSNFEQGLFLSSRECASIPLRGERSNHNAVSRSLRQLQYPGTVWRDRSRSHEFKVLRRKAC